MTVGFFQRFQVAVLLFIVRTIWAVDVLTGEIFEKVVRAISWVAVIIVSSAFLAGLAFSFKTGYLQQVGDGVLSVVNHSAQILGQEYVLGAQSTKQELPALVNQLPFPEVTAKAVLIADRGAKKVIYEKDIYSRYASASTTKLMTAMVVLEIYSPSDEVVISKECAELDSSKAGLPEGLTFKSGSLFDAMLIASAGDAACALAEGKVGTDEFLYLMNQKAYKLGLSSTFFTNAIGLDGDNSSQFSTAWDLYKLAVAAMEQDPIRNTVKKTEYLIKSIDEKFIGKLETTNKLLLEVPNSIGVKTGKTTEAGEVLIYEYKDKVKDLMIIVMGSEDRFGDVRALLNWTLNSYSWGDADSVL